MKRSGTCPRCGGTDITTVLTSDFYENDPRILAGAFSNSVKMTRFVCCDCGYVEYWVDPAEFKRNAKAYWDKKTKEQGELDELDEYWRQQLKEKKEKEAREAEQSKKNKGKLPWEF